MTHPVLAMTRPQSGLTRRKSHSARRTLAFGAVLPPPGRSRPAGLETARKICEMVEVRIEGKEMTLRP